MRPVRVLRDFVIPPSHSFDLMSSGSYRLDRNHVCTVSFTQPTPVYDIFRGLCTRAACTHALCALQAAIEALREAWVLIKPFHLS